MKRFIIVMALMLSGCASAVKYGAVGANWWASDTGYSERKISQDTYHVLFQGNGHNTSVDCQGYFLRRAAEIAHDQGFAYFVVKDSVAGYTSQLGTTWQNYQGTVKLSKSQGGEGFYAVADLLGRKGP